MLYKKFWVGLLLASMSTQAQAKVNVIVSFHPLYDMVKQVAGSQATVERAAAAGGSPHTFDPTVRDIAKIRKADLAIMAGLGADSWLEKYVKASGGDGQVLKLGNTMKFNRLRIGEETDPHWWLDASLMAQAAKVVGQKLATLDAQNAAQYRQNAEKASQQFMKLHQELKTSLKPIQGGKMLTFHNAFGYFARAYGLKIVGTIAPMHEISPSVKSVAKSVQMIKKKGVKAVFSEPQLPAGPARTVAKDAGVKLFTLDPAGSSSAPTYTEMMLYNRDQLLKALK